MLIDVTTKASSAVHAAQRPWVLLFHCYHGTACDLLWFVVFSVEGVTLCRQDA